MKLFKSILTVLLVSCVITFAHASSVKIFDTAGVPQGLSIKSGKVGILDGLSIAAGDDSDILSVHKFGEAPDFDTADLFVTMWDGADDGGIAQFTYNYSTTAIIDSISSSSASDIGDTEIQGLDVDWNLVVQTVTMTGQIRKALTTDLVRIFRIKNAGSSDFVGTPYIYENTAIVTGVPTDKTKVRALVQIGNNQTLMAIYSIPAGYTGYMYSFDASGANGTFNNLGQSIIKLYARPFGGVFQLKRIIALNSAGESFPQKLWEVPEKFAEKTDIEIRVNTSVDASAIAGGFDLVLVAN